MYVPGTAEQTRGNGTPAGATEVGQSLGLHGHRLTQPSSPLFFQAESLHHAPPARTRDKCRCTAVGHSVPMLTSAPGAAIASPSSTSSCSESVIVFNLLNTFLFRFSTGSIITGFCCRRGLPLPSTPWPPIRPLRVDGNCFEFLLEGRFVTKPEPKLGARRTTSRESSS